jgi:ATP-binding cassette, subfamily B, bacterial MsbA
MKTYFRILKYAPGIGPRGVKFMFFALLGIIFSLVNFALMIPVLDTLFSYEPGVTVVPPLPEPAISGDYLKGAFDHYFLGIVDKHGPLKALQFVGVLLIASVFLTNAFRYVERMTASKIKVDVIKNIRMDLFRKVSGLHIGYFNTQRKGDLISRFTNDAIEVEQAVFNSLKFVIKEPFTIVFYFVALFMINVKLTLFTLIILPVTGGILSEIIKRLKKKAKLNQKSVGRIVNILDETFSGMRVVKAFNARNFIIGRLEQETAYHRRVNLSMARKNELASPVSETIGVMIVATILYVGGSIILEGQGGLNAGEFLVFLAIFASIIQPAKNFSNGITSVQKGTVAADRIFSVMDLDPVITDKPNAIALKEFKDKIEFRNVSFAYDRELVLKDINLVIEKGKTVALVGSSGGGKSTLADLVPRFYDPTSGQILLDGVPLTDYKHESIIDQLGVVTQESILFNDTIFNNIAFGLPNVEEEDVIRAAKIANAHDFITQTESGYQTMIGERGSKLSGGQRQRVSIARAILKNPPILILDEATSALDTESERLVQDALNNLMMNRTSIVIAHRLSTIQHADEIVVIQEGRIAERGSHDQLLSLNGVYKKLNEIQRP